MNRAVRVAIFLPLSFLFLLPPIVIADGLVPCGGPGEEPCQTCHVVDLVDNVIRWLIGILSIVAAIIIAYAGFLLVTSGGNVNAKEKAKTYINNILIGYTLVLAGWLIIDTVIKSLLDEQEFGMWNTISCIEQPEIQQARQIAIVFDSIAYPYQDASRGTAAFTNVDMTSVDSSDARLMALPIANISAPEADALIAQAAAQQGIASQTINLQALMRVESGGCANNFSPAGALGCMQIMPDTARSYDPALRNASAAEVQSRLLDPNYNIPLGVEIYNDLYRLYNGDTRLTFAAYNGGPGANNPSRDCPGLRRWECPWDSPGCYNTSRTDCTPNTGYQETRNYVIKVEATAQQLR